MQYPYLKLLEIFTVILTVFATTAAFYFLLKFSGKKANFSTCLKVFLLYDFFSAAFYFLFPRPFLAKTIDSAPFKILDFFIFSAILFAVFHLLAKKFFSLGLKRSLAIFFVMVLLMFPALDFLRMRFFIKVHNISVFAPEATELGGALKAGIPEPMFFKIMWKVESGLLSWPNVYFGVYKY